MNKMFSSQLLILILLASFLFGQSELKTHKKVLKLMGTRFEIIAVTKDKALAEKSIDLAINEIIRIEKLISSWDVNSQTSEINRNAGIKPVKVDKELFQLIKRSKKISTLTNGIFDISFASLDKIWKFDGSMSKLPDELDMMESVSKINFKNIILDGIELTVFLKYKGMKIGFGGIGKGYAANKAKKIMKELGIANGVVNASGDLNTWGNQEDGKEWGIAITDPNNKEKNTAWLNISSKSVVTSGNYEKFAVINGKNYTHIINPKTGMPISETKSVTIISNDAEFGDALSTSVFILGEHDGIDLINTLKNVECILVNSQNELITSNGIDLNYINVSK
ncbi:MAG: FAD:protein FMN transferase [Ignavibacteriae bacterium]|nr:FAD:protein FMN transferase [Ignavibacteriota bacterium]